LNTLLLLEAVVVAVDQPVEVVVVQVVFVLVLVLLLLPHRMESPWVAEDREQQLLIYQTVRMVRILFSVQSLQRVEVEVVVVRLFTQRVEMVVQVVEDAIVVLVVQAIPLQQPHLKEMMVVGLPVQDSEVAVVVEVILLLELLELLLLVVLVEQEQQVAYQVALSLMLEVEVQDAGLVVV
jgi:hypothetical protein